MSRSLLPTIFALLLAATLAGCALPARMPVIDHDLLIEGAEISEDSLWQITITRSGMQKFSGLLATRLDAGGLYYVLLDGTGVTLLEARITPDGDREPIRELEILRDHRLPSFLAQSLHRIFFLEPAAEPCGRNLLLRLCRKNPDELRMFKFARFGFLPLWSVEYAAAPEIVADDWAGITFTNPWLKLTLQLDRV